MNKIRLIFAILMVALVSFATVGCKGGGGDEPATPSGGNGNGGGNTPGPDNQTPAAKYLTAAEFQNSSWKGTQAISTSAELKVAATEMTLTYWVKKTVSKNTPDEFNQLTIKIKPYTFDEKTAKFSGTGDDKVTYSGELSSKTQLKITLPSESVTMNKQ